MLNLSLESRRRAVLTGRKSTALFLSCPRTSDEPAGSLWYCGCGASGRLATWRLRVAGISVAGSVVGAAEGEGHAVPEGVQVTAVSFFVSCDTATGEYAAMRNSAIPPMRIE